MVWYNMCILYIVWVDEDSQLPLFDVKVRPSGFDPWPYVAFQQFQDQPTRSLISVCIMWGRDSLPKQPDPGHEYLEKGRPEEMMCSLQVYFGDSGSNSFTHQADQVANTLTYVEDLRFVVSQFLNCPCCNIPLSSFAITICIYIYLDSKYSAVFRIPIITL